MKVTSFHIQKGGTGKTSISGAVAYELSQTEKTLVIDGDPQGSFTNWMLPNPPKYELADVLLGRCLIEEAIVQTSFNNLHVMGTSGIKGELKLYGETKLHHEPFIFIDMIDEIRKMSFTQVIIDLSPSIGTLERAMLIASDEVITPITPEFFSLYGLEIFVSEMTKLKKQMKTSPIHQTVIINSYDSRISHHKDVLDSLNGNQFKVLKIPVEPAFRKGQVLHTFPQLVGVKKETTETISKIVKGMICH